MKLNFQNKKVAPKVEITLQVRDKNGNPTGQTKSYEGNSGLEVSSWYSKQEPKEKRKKKRRTKKSKGED